MWQFLALSIYTDINVKLLRQQCVKIALPVAGVCVHQYCIQVWTGRSSPAAL